MKNAGLIRCGGEDDGNDYEEGNDEDSDEEKKIISEREFDETILKSMDVRRRRIGAQMDELEDVRRVYFNKCRQKDYDEVRLIFYKVGKDYVKYETKPRTVGFGEYD
jgi:hypothetical protein